MIKPHAKLNIISWTEICKWLYNQVQITDWFVSCSIKAAFGLECLKRLHSPSVGANVLQWLLWRRWSASARGSICVSSAQIAREGRECGCSHWEKSHRGRDAVTPRGSPVKITHGRLHQQKSAHRRPPEQRYVLIRRGKHVGSRKFKLA